MRTLVRSKTCSFVFLLLPKITFDMLKYLMMMAGQHKGKKMDSGRLFVRFAFGN